MRIRHVCSMNDVQCNSRNAQNVFSLYIILMALCSCYQGPSPKVHTLSQQFRFSLLFDGHFVTFYTIHNDVIYIFLSFLNSQYTRLTLVYGQQALTGLWLLKSLLGNECQFWVLFDGFRIAHGNWVQRSLKWVLNTLGELIIFNLHFSVVIFRISVVGNAISV